MNELSSVVPARFLFRCEFPVARAEGRPRRRGSRPLNFDDRFLLPNLAALDGGPQFAELRVGWNPDGIGFSVLVSGKQSAPRCDFEKPSASDGLQLWIDTRNTQTVHRATRYCHHFCLLPCGGPDPSAAVGVQLPVARAREDAPLCEPDDLLVASEADSDGYRLEAWLPQSVLHGFDPVDQPRLGFCYRVLDAELGSQTLSVEGDYPFASDPSLWSTLLLTDDPRDADSKTADVSA